MLDINYEFRKGIFFIRLIGEMNDKNYSNVKAHLEELIKVNNLLTSTFVRVGGGAKI